MIEILTFPPMCTLYAGLAMILPISIFAHASEAWSAATGLVLGSWPSLVRFGVIHMKR